MFLNCEMKVDSNIFKSLWTEGDKCAGISAWSKGASLTLPLMRSKKGRATLSGLRSPRTTTTENLCDLEQIHFTLTLLFIGVT